MCTSECYAGSSDCVELNVTTRQGTDDDPACTWNYQAVVVFGICQLNFHTTDQ